MSDQQQPAKSFQFEFDGDHYLTIEQIWPDGDAPENPTVDDVIAVLQKSCGSVSRVIGDWELGCSVLVNGKDAGLRGY